MKPVTLRLNLILFALLAALTASAQQEQSAIYDAIGLLNAKHGVNLIMMPDVPGYQMIDPVKGVVVKTAQMTPLTGADVDPKASQQVIMKILARNAGLKDDATLDAIKEKFKDNPFLREIFSAGFKRLDADKALIPDQINGNMISTSSGSPGVNLVSNLTNGSADYLIKRANEELTISVIAKLQAFIARYPEFKILFDHTVTLIQPVEPYDYQKKLGALKCALKEDLDVLPAQLPLLYQLPRYKTLNARVPVMTLIFTASAVVNEMNGKFGLGKSLHDLDSCGFLQAENNYAGVIRVVSAVSDGLRKKTLSGDESLEYDYISPSEIAQVTNNNAANKLELSRYFLGLIYQHVSAIPFWVGQGKQSAAELLASWDKNEKLTSLIDNIIASGSKLQSLQTQLSDLKKNDMTIGQLTGKSFFSVERFTLYNQLIVTSMQLCEPFVSGSDASSALKQEFSRVTNYWPPFSQSGISMVKAFSQKDYPLAVQNLSSMLQTVSQYMESREGDDAFVKSAKADAEADAGKDIDAINDKLKTVNVQLKTLSGTDGPTVQDKIAISGQTQALEQQLIVLNAQMDAAVWQKKNADKVLFTLSKVIEYYQLFAALTQAENSAAVESLLETYALPAGSSRVKKETAANIAINAYVGMFFARSKSNGTGFTNQYGLTAPIGATFSLGAGQVGSFSAFVGLVDIGSIIRYKLNSQGAYEQNINFAGLVSPSLHFVYGFPGYLPLSLGAGVQWTTPTTTADTHIQLMPHFNAFFAIDIPLFNLAVSRKKGKDM
ncbi:hypothetical protein PQ469_16235 [Mucilaginibacter sp. KACC 22773]|uniref:hypothetical protein n=1 Tax=Mucilaginibacter sp. KACC 22773 TaxID=3025671 RepID=UPI0023657F09|nr:hypothetical protein [Mucilaginibacter sp. KACC 22773]WDF75439.1 hypothetical protein PQ469_16235 [Mucilaginibacter sp. KACC 22773]